MFDGVYLVIRTTLAGRDSQSFRGETLEQHLECMACPASSIENDPSDQWTTPLGLCARKCSHCSEWAIYCLTVFSQRYAVELLIYYQGRMLPNPGLAMFRESECETQHLVLYSYIVHGATQSYSNDMPTTTNKIDGISEPVDGEATVVQETVTFHDDGTVVLREFPKYVSIGESFRDASVNARTHEIENFLGRPVLCASGVWSTTSLVGSQLQTIPLPSACFSNAAYADKVRGFFGFRAKMVCRVQVNSQRFQQGRLLLHYLPQTATMSTYRRLTALASLVTITQQPRVDLNLNEDTEVRLEIPYVSNSLYYSLADGSFDFGTFYLTVYSLLRTGSGATTVNYSVYCHFEDVEVSFPAVSQMGVKTLKARGGSSRGDVQDVELNNAGLGPLSGGLARVAGAGMILSEIPMLSAFTAPAAWAAGVLSRAADALGFCKPTNSAPTERRTLTSFAHMNNSNAIDNSVKMAVRSDNHVQMVPGFGGTDIDEMSFAHILGIPAYVQAVSWTTGQGVGASVYTNFCFLGNYEVRTVSGQSLRFCPPMGYVSNHFQWYRGSICYKIKVVKTEFHSGRLQISFFPGKNLAIGTASLASSQYVFREILDLRTASEITVTMPWTALTPYYKVTDSYGIIDVRVINPLIAPDAISTTVDVVLEVFCAEDFEFACPVPARLIPSLYSSQCGVERFRSQTGVVSATSEQSTHVIDESTVRPEIQPSLYCVGERILSIRQMVKRFTTMYVAASGIAPANSFFSVDSSVNYVPSVGLTDGYKSLSEVRTDMLSYYAACFRFVRGGTRLKIIDPSVSGAWYVNTYQGAVGSMSTAPVSFSTTSIVTNGLDQPVVVVPSLTGGIEVEMPYYNATHASHVRIVTGFAGSSDVREATDSAMLLQINPAQTNAAAPTSYSPAMRIYRAAADDYSLGFFIGVPPLNGTSQGGVV